MRLFLAVDEHAPGNKDEDEGDNEDVEKGVVADGCLHDENLVFADLLIDVVCFHMLIHVLLGYRFENFSLFVLKRLFCLCGHGVSVFLV